MTVSVRIASAALSALALLAVPAQGQTKKELITKVLALQQPGIEAMARTIAERPAIEMSMAARPYLQNVPADKREGDSLAAERVDKAARSRGDA